MFTQQILSELLVHAQQNEDVFGVQRAKAVIQRWSWQHSTVKQHIRAFSSSFYICICPSTASPSLTERKWLGVVCILTWWQAGDWRCFTALKWNVQTVSPHPHLCCFSRVHILDVYLACDAWRGRVSTSIQLARTVRRPQLTEHVISFRQRKTEITPVCFALFCPPSLHCQTSQWRSLVLLMLSGSFFLNHLAALSVTWESAAWAVWEVLCSSSMLRQTNSVRVMTLLSFKVTTVKKVD